MILFALEKIKRMRIRSKPYLINYRTIFIVYGCLGIREFIEYNLSFMVKD